MRYGLWTQVAFFFEMGVDGYRGCIEHLRVNGIGFVGILGFLKQLLGFLSYLIQ